MAETMCYAYNKQVCHHDEGHDDGWLGVVEMRMVKVEGNNDDDDVSPIGPSAYYPKWKSCRNHMQCLQEACPS